MKNHASGHGKKGNPGYRTPSTFRSEVQRKYRGIKVSKGFKGPDAVLPPWKGGAVK